MRIELDVLLAEDETPAQLRSYLRTRFQVEVEEAPVQFNSALTLLITGSREQLNRVKAWHAANRKPRPDLVGKPPVGKGEKRT